MCPPINPNKKFNRTKSQSPMSNPILNNPIARRELVGALRTRRAWLMQVGLASALALLVIMRWPTEVNTGARALEVFGVFGYGLLIGVIFLSPVFPATSIVRELQRGTLSLLLNSPLGPWRILWGKLLGTLGFSLVLLTMSLPAAAACYAMSGIELTKQFSSLYLVLMLVAMQYGVLGLWVSTLAANSESALRMTYAGVLGLSVLPLAPYWVLHSMLDGPLLDVAQWLLCVSPIPAVMEICGHTRLLYGAVEVQEVAVGRYIIVALVTIVIGAVGIGSRLNAGLFDRVRAAGNVTDERSASVQVFRRFLYMWFFDPKRRSALIGPMVNPVMVKEFRTRFFGRSHWMIRMVLGCMIVSLVLMLATASSTMIRGTDVGALMALLQIALIVLITPSIAGGLISSEVETGGWQMLMMTPLSPRRIITGKLLSVAWTLLLVLLATVPGYGVMMFIEPWQSAAVGQVILTLAMTAVFSLVLTAAVSSLIPRTSTATAAAYALLIMLIAGTMLIWLGRDAPFSHSTVEMALRLNPLAASLGLIGVPQFKSYDLLPYNWWFLGLGSMASLVVLSFQTWRLSRPQ
jgi:ABC-type transport system involved in multi-copper enzyme maturation permease subunit